jgi:hypothetical protein
VNAREAGGEEKEADDECAHPDTLNIGCYLLRKKIAIGFIPYRTTRYR